MSVLLYKIALLLSNNNALIMLSPTIIGGERGKKLLLISPVSQLGNVRGSISYRYISEITRNYQAQNTDVNITFSFDDIRILHS